MDSSSENCKQLRPENGQILGQHYDWLSNLPTDILRHILSYLDNAEVVKTGLLSRRWRYIWASVPCLNFDFRPFRKERLLIYSYHACVSKFWELVEENLIIRDSSTTYKLRFFCDGYGEEQFKLLLSFCAMRNVEEFILLAGCELQHCPCCTDHGSPIKQKFNGLVNLQQSFRAFDNLKTLHLVKVQFPHPDITEKLFSDCGVLENLLMEYCCFAKINVLNISAHKLRNFHFVNEDHYRCGNRCEFEGELKVDTPSLVSFCYIGPQIIPCEFFSDMPFLNHAEIQIPHGVYETKLNPRMGTMISHIHGVKELSLSKVFVLVCIHSYNMLVLKYLYFSHF